MTAWMIDEDHLHMVDQSQQRHCNCANVLRIEPWIVIRNVSLCCVYLVMYSPLLIC